jgi:hypothetical protein
VITWILTPAAEAAEGVSEQDLDPALFVALYLGVVGTVFALGEPRNSVETYLRAGALFFCAIIAVIMILWLSVGIFKIAGWIG